jgi:hypothetical protein
MKDTLAFSLGLAALLVSAAAGGMLAFTGVAQADVVVPASATGAYLGSNNGFPLNLAEFDLSSEDYQQIICLGVYGTRDDHRHRIPPRPARPNRWSVRTLDFDAGHHVGLQRDSRW